MIKFLKFLFALFLLIEINSCTHSDISHKSTGNIGQDISKDINIKNAQFELVIGKDTVPIDTIILKKINPNWTDRVDVISSDSIIKHESLSKVLINIRTEYYSDAKKTILKN